MFMHSCMWLVYVNREEIDRAVGAIAWPKATAGPEGAVKPTGGRLIQEHFKIVFCRENGCFSTIVFFKTVLMDVWTKKKNVFWIVVWVWLYKRIAEKTAKQMTGRSPGRPRRGREADRREAYIQEHFKIVFCREICFLSMVDFWKGCIDMIK